MSIRTYGHMGNPLQREKWQIIIGKISVGHWLFQVARYGHSYTLCVQGVQIFGNPHLPILFLHCDKDSTRGNLAPSIPNSILSYVGCQALIHRQLHPPTVFFNGEEVEISSLDC